MLNNRQSKRLSNFELLRIFAMLMIIFHHLMAHCFFPQLTDPLYMNFHNNGVFNNPVFYKKLFLPELLSPLGKAADGIFLIISGYFSVERDSNINLFKTTKKLLLQVGFATVVLIVISLIMYPHQTSDNRVGVIMSINNFNYNWWFVGYYFIISIIGAFYINKKVNSISKEAYKTLLIVLFALVSFTFTGVFMESLANGFRTIIAGLFCYLWGGYCKKYNPLKKVRIVFIFLGIILLFVLVCVTYYSATISNIDRYLIGDQNNTYIQLYGTNYYSDFGVVPICLSILIFEVFRRINIPYNAVINYIASSCFMVYLFHENDFVRDLWRYNVDLVSLLYFSPVQFCLKTIILALLTFGVGVLVFSIYYGLTILFSRIRQIFLSS